MCVQGAVLGFLSLTGALRRSEAIQKTDQGGVRSPHPPKGGGSMNMRPLKGERCPPLSSRICAPLPVVSHTLGTQESCRGRPRCGMLQELL